MDNTHFNRVLGAFLGVAASIGTLISSASFAQAADFSDQQVRMIVPLSPGGGVDTTARLIAPFLTKYLPGNPEVVIENRPGGGSLLGAKYFEQTAEPDGLTILFTSSSTMFPYVFEMPGADFDLSSMPLAFSYPLGAVIYASSSSGLASGAELNTDHEPMIYGGISASGSDMPILLGLDLLGVERKTVLGFPGRGPARLAFERGETNLDFQVLAVYQSQVQALVDSGAATPLLVPGRIGADGALTERDPFTPDLPSVYEAYITLNGQAPSGDMWDAYKMAAKLTFGFGLAAFTAEGTSENVLSAYQDAIAAMIEDPEFLEAALARSGGYLPIAGADVTAAAQTALRPDPKTVEFLKTYLTETYGVSF